MSLFCTDVGRQNKVFFKRLICLNEVPIEISDSEKVFNCQYVDVQSLKAFHKSNLEIRVEKSRKIDFSRIF